MPKRSANVAYPSDRARDDRDLAILAALDAGERAEDVAARFGVSPTYPRSLRSRIDREFWESETPTLKGKRC
jgi:hypothetical protein